MKIIIAIIFFIILITSNANANTSIIRDSEIEETIELVIAPLKISSDIQDLKIYLIQDEIPNAFTVGKNIIFINSGLITAFPDPDVLRGIVAHEIGHILGHHIIRQQEIVNNYTMAAMGTAAIGIATAIATGAPGIAIMMAGSHVADRSIMSYSRTFESSADQAALRLLEKSRHSAIGMVKFFEETKSNSRYSLINPYDQTHPLSHDRLIILNNEIKKSKYKVSQNSTDLIYKFQRAATKLAAYTVPIEKLQEPNFYDNRNELREYFRAIKFFRTGDFQKALNSTNNIIAIKPNDPFYHELKAQILFEFGKDEALNEYNIVVNMRKIDPLMLLGRAIVGITLYKNNKEQLSEFYKDLSFVIKKEPDNILALYYMAIYYEINGMKGKSYLNSAIIANKLWHEKDAKKLASAAIKMLKPNTPDWYKAHDIIETNK